MTDAIGVDASRYSLARTDYNSPVDIDLNLLSSHSNENPVYYVQYAHAPLLQRGPQRGRRRHHLRRRRREPARHHRRRRSARRARPVARPAAQAGDLRAPHRVAHYLEDLAATYHKWYNVERVVPMELTDPEARENRPTPSASPRLRNRHFSVST